MFAARGAYFETCGLAPGIGATVLDPQGIWLGSRVGLWVSGACETDAMLLQRLL